MHLYENFIYHFHGALLLLTVARQTEQQSKESDFDIVSRTGDSASKNFSEMQREFSSPFHLSIDLHEENMKKFTKSPGDGFIMNSRPMFYQTVSEESEANMVSLFINLSF